MFATSRAARSQTQVIRHVIQIVLWSLLALVKIYVGLTTSQTHTDLRPMELPNSQSAGSKKVPLHSLFSRVFQKSGWEKPWNAFFCEAHKTNWQTASHRLKEESEQ